jgi:drug/metabolite transporter (DMT)-like permease
MGHLWRGLVGVSAMACGFTALGLLPLPEVTAIGFAAPILATVFAAMFLGERLRIHRMAAVTAGLAGVVIVLWPRLTLGAEATDAATLGAVVMLMGAVLMALAQVFTRRLVRTEGTAAIVFWFSVTCTCASLITIPTWVVPTAEEAALLVAAGVLGGLGQVFLTMSYRFAETAVIAPFDYVAMLFSIAVGWAVFAEAPTPRVLVGAALVVAAGIFIIWRESRLGLDRGPARQTTPTQG